MLMCKVQVARAIEMRQIVTSLGPAYIKLGQALSIRPDLLSPAAMVEMQKLCDKARPCQHTHLDQDAKRLRPKGWLCSLWCQLVSAHVPAQSALLSLPRAIITVDQLHFTSAKACHAQVPSFDSNVAMEVVRQEFGAPWHEVFAELSPEPIAAASLGQVR